MKGRVGGKKKHNNSPSRYAYQQRQQAVRCRLLVCLCCSYEVVLKLMTDELSLSLLSHVYDVARTQLFRRCEIHDEQFPS